MASRKLIKHTLHNVSFGEILQCSLNLTSHPGLRWKRACGDRFWVQWMGSRPGRVTADTGICRLMATHSVRVRAHLHTPYNPNITASIDNVLVEKNNDVFFLRCWWLQDQTHSNCHNQKHSLLRFDLLFSHWLLTSHFYYTVFYHWLNLN